MIDSPAILVDTTRCTGCETCVLACKKVNNLGPDRLRPGQEAVDSLSSTRFTTILRRPEDLFVKQQCLHCLDPACVSACPVGAMQKTPEGPVVYDSELCFGCRYCMVACPYDALLFGTREDLLAEGHRRIAANSGAYLPRIYGEKEAGGTSILYLADTSLGFLGAGGEVGEDQLPSLSWASLTKVPPVIVGMASLMGGVHWIIRRRMQLAVQAGEDARQEGEEVSSAPSEGEEKDD